MSNNDVIIYTDGSSRGNPGPGGYGIVMEDCKTGFSKQYSKGFQNTTNNRMEPVSYTHLTLPTNREV